MPVLPVSRVLKALAQMGADAEERKIELHRLLTDSQYWLKWCAESDWLVHQLTS